MDRPNPVAAIVDPAMRDIIEERQRQVRKEGWTFEHDDQHNAGELAAAGAAYALHAADVLHPQSQGDGGFDSRPPLMWPWDRAWWKPSGAGTNQAGARRDLVKAAALLLAEIERMDREESRRGK